MNRFDGMAAEGLAKEIEGEEGGAIMEKEEAIALYRQIQQGGGTHLERMEYLEKFGAGEIARKLWNSGEFTLGLEYGILIALAKVYGLSEDV